MSKILYSANISIRSILRSILTQLLRGTDLLTHKLACVRSTSRPVAAENQKVLLKQRLNFLLCTLPDIQVEGGGESLSRLIPRSRRIMNFQWARDF